MLVPHLVFYGEELTIVDCSTFLGSCMTKDGSMTVKVNKRISRA